MKCPHCGKEINEIKTNNMLYYTIAVMYYIFVFPTLIISSISFILSGFLGMILGFVKLFGELFNWNSAIIDNIGISGTDLPIFLEFLSIEAICIIVLFLGLGLLMIIKFFYTKIKNLKVKQAK